jgi:hypothetical protein
MKLFTEAIHSLFHWHSPLSLTPRTKIEAVQSIEATISNKIVAGNEPAVSGGLGSQAITHNGSGAM